MPERVYSRRGEEVLRVGMAHPRVLLRKESTPGGAACHAGELCCSACFWWGVAALPREFVTPLVSKSAVSTLRVVTLRRGY
jgi:hypothetical protein